MTFLRSLFVCASMAVLPVFAQSKLSGTPIGSPSVNNHSYLNAFDGKADTYFESSNQLTDAQKKKGENNSFRNNWIPYVGLDFGTPHVITQIQLKTPADATGMAVLGIFQGANNADFTDAVPLYIIASENTSGEYEANINCSKGFRYVRFVGSSVRDAVSELRCKVSEIAFYGTEGEGDDTHYPQLTNLPTVVVNTTPEDPSSPWLVPQAYDKEEDIPSNVIFIKGNVLNLTAAGTTRERGNNSRMYHKKPMRIKFTDKQKPMDAKANKKKWTLINSGPDNTLMRNALAFEISRRVGMLYTPYCQNVDLVYNGEYKGTYQFCDQVELAKKRIEGDELEPTDLREPEITGAYHCEIDYYASQEAAGCWFEIPNGFPVTIKSPDFEGTTEAPGPTVPEQYNYIKQYWADAYKAVDQNTPTRLDIIDGWRGYFDADSWYRYAIVEEIVGNGDAATSIHTVKRRNDPHIYAACVWDHDKAFGNGGYDAIYDNSSFTKGNSTGTSAAFVRWITRENISNDNSKYKEEVNQLWSYLRNKDGDNISKESLAAWIDAKKEEYAQSANLNFKRWGFGNGIADGEKESYDGAVAHLREWVMGRVDNIENATTGIINYDNTITEYPVPEVYTPETNLALYKHADATTTLGNNVPFQAIDGKLNNYWENNTSLLAVDEEGKKLQQFTVNLGKEYKVNKVVLLWRDVCVGKAYDIQLSADGVHFLTVASETAGDTFVQEAGTIYKRGEYTFDAYNARYVRMQGREPVNMGNGYAICEFQVYGDSEAEAQDIPEDADDAVVHEYDIPDVKKSLAYRKAATADLKENDNMEPSKAVDGDINTRWATGSKPEAMAQETYNSMALTVDLGDTYLIHTIYTFWENAFGKDYDLQVSTDGTTFTTIKEIRNGKVNDFKHTFDPVKAHYVRMQGITPSGGYGYSLWEFLVYGDAFHEVTVGAAGYATYVLPEDIDFTKTEGLTAFRVSGINDNGRAVVKDDFEKARQGDALVLKGEPATYALHVSTSQEGTFVGENLLQASDGTVTGDGQTIYAMAKKNDIVGFYVVAEGVSIPAGKAYMELPAGMDSKDYFPFTEEEEEEPAEPVQEERPDEPAVTNIQALEGILTEQDAFYNLNGMRVNRLQKGVYIHHGKKVVIK